MKRTTMGRLVTTALVIQIAMYTLGRADSPAVNSNVTRVVAQKESNKSGRPSRPPGKSPRAATVSKELESRVDAFVKEHQRELFEVLIYLKENLPREYERAVRDLDRTQQRLAQLQKRDAERYALELKLWQAESRAQLLAARIQMQSDGDDTLQRQLRETLTATHDLRLQLLERERERLADRLRKLDAQIGKLQESRKTAIERQFRSLVGPGEASNRSTPTAEAN